MGVDKQYMKFENTQVMNFEGAFRGLRNPLESWDKNDSTFSPEGVPLLGPNDLDLAQRMIKAGASDRKFLRQIFVSVDITAPLFWWKEADTYKIGTTANSTSTMHKITSYDMQDINNYESQDYLPDLQLIDPIHLGVRIDGFLETLEQLKQLYIETKDKKYWRELIRWLPNGWLQTRTWTANYETLRNIYSQRKTHKLVEWHMFCDWIKKLPYSSELITFNLDK